MVSEQIKFAGEQGSLLLEVSGYENPLATNEDDANWLASTLTIKAGPFAGVFRVAFTTHDLISLRDRLKNGLAALSETVSFQSTEDDIAFDIEFNKRGAATISGTAQPHRSLEASLTFRLDTDQSALAQTLRQLETVVRRFPTRQIQQL